MLDDVDREVVPVEELGDVLGSMVLSYDGASIFKGLDEGDGSRRGHREPFVFGEFVAALFVNGLTQLACKID
jgi:hypothetical protein